MKPSQQNELILYLQESISALQKIKGLLSNRNKTTKFKAIGSMLTIIEARMDGTLKYAKAGGYTALDLTLQQQMYNPIIEWLAEEIVK